jgi:hypothetical protein
MYIYIYILYVCACMHAWNREGHTFDTSWRSGKKVPLVLLTGPMASYADVC